MVRIATAAVLAPLLWVLIKLAPPVAFVGITAAMILLASWECYRMLEARGARPFKWLGLVAGAGLVWSFADVAPRFEAHLPLITLGIVALGLAMWRRADPQQMLDAAIHTVFPVLFVGLGLAYLAGLRVVGEDGQDLLMLLFLCVILADTTAFYVGSRFGRRRLAPRLSPNKSWEGALGGLMASCLGGAIAHVWFYQRLPLGHALMLGGMLGAAAIAGDLAESMVKRAAGVKDASTLLPGHGGVLDRTDSLLFSGPLLYFYYRLFLQGAA